VRSSGPLLRLTDVPDRSDHYRSLVRRDLLTVAAGVAAAVASVVLILIGRLDVIAERRAATIVVVLALVVGAWCVGSWLLGPVELRRDRYILGIPVFLIAAPALVAFSMLGGGAAVVVLSSAVAFSAAIAAGLAIASRRSTR
jgi:hypothetical protein